VTDGGRHIVVGRLRKPHGLKGDTRCFLTAEPERLLAPGAEVWLVGLDGEVVAGPVTIERSRSYHREWLIKFVGADGREALEPWRGLFLAVPPERITPPAEDEVYLHELAGSRSGCPTARRSTGKLVVRDAIRADDRGAGPQAEFLPYKKEFVRGGRPGGRRLVVTLPDGLLERGIGGG
jgi:hypothetical protein